MVHYNKFDLVAHAFKFIVGCQGPVCLNQQILILFFPMNLSSSNTFTVKNQGGKLSVGCLPAEVN